MSLSYSDVVICNAYDEEKLGLDPDFFEKVWTIVYIHDLTDPSLSPVSVPKLGYDMYKELNGNNNSSKPYHSVASFDSQGIVNFEGKIKVRLTLYDPSTKVPYDIYLNYNDANLIEYGMFIDYTEKNIIYNIHDAKLYIEHGSSTKYITDISLVIDDTDVIKLGPIHSNISIMICNAHSYGEGEIDTSNILISEDIFQTDTLLHKLSGGLDVDLVATLASRDKYLLSVANTSYIRYAMQTFNDSINSALSESGYAFDNLASLDSIVKYTMELYYEKLHYRHPDKDSILNQGDATAMLDSIIAMNNSNSLSYAYRMHGFILSILENIAYCYEQNKLNIDGEITLRDDADSLEELQYIETLIVDIDQSQLKQGSTVDNPILNVTNIETKKTDSSFIPSVGRYQPEILLGGTGTEIYTQGIRYSKSDFIVGPNKSKEMYSCGIIGASTHMAKPASGNIIRAQKVYLFNYNKYNDSEIGPQIIETSMDNHTMYTYYLYKKLNTEDDIANNPWFYTEKSIGRRVPSNDILTRQDTSKVGYLYQTNNSKYSIGKYWVGDINYMTMNQLEIMPAAIQLFTSTKDCMEYEFNMSSTSIHACQPAEKILQTQYAAESMVANPYCPLFKEYVGFRATTMSIAHFHDGGYLCNNHQGGNTAVRFIDRVDLLKDAAMTLRLVQIANLIQKKEYKQAMIMVMLTMNNTGDALALSGSLFKHLIKPLVDVMDKMMNEQERYNYDNPDPEWYDGPTPE